MKTKNVSARAVLFLLMAVLGVTSCKTEHVRIREVSPWCKNDDDRIREVTSLLNDVERSQNFWGKISVSDFVLIENKGQFKINFSEDVTNYVQAARTSVVGGERSSTETSSYLGAGLQGLFAPPISVGSASASSNAASPPGLPTQAGTAMSNFTPLLALGGLAPGVDEQQAVAKAINDKITEILLELVANPDVATNRQRILFGLMQVTCQPGQRTRRGYLADLAVSLSYSPDGFQPLKKNFPSAVAVLPLVVSQNVQLQRSDRQRLELAAALSAAFAAKGLSAAATTLANYVTQQESDVNTRNSVPVITSYTAGPLFGFQIYPSLQAIAEPGKTKSGPGNVLQPITFPAVVAIIIGKDDVDPRTTFSSGDIINVKSIADHLKGGLDAFSIFLRTLMDDAVNDPLDRFEKKAANTNWFTEKLVEELNKVIDGPSLAKRPGFPSITLREDTQKLQAKNPTGPDRIRLNRLILEDAYPEELSRDPKTNELFLITDTQTRWIHLDGRTCEEPLSDLISRAKSMDKARAALEDLSSSPNFEKFKSQYQQLEIAKESLEMTALSFRGGHPLPTDLFKSVDPHAPLISDVYPHFVWRNFPTTFTVLGTNLNDATDVTVAGIACENVHFIEGSLTGIKATLPFPSPFLSMTNTTNSIDFVVSGPKFQTAKSFNLALQGEPLADAVASISRDTNGKVSGIALKRGENVDQKQLLDALREVLKKSERAPKTTHIIP